MKPTHIQVSSYMVKQGLARWRTAKALAAFMRRPPTPAITSNIHPPKWGDPTRLTQLQIAKSHMSSNPYAPAQEMSGLLKQVNKLDDVTPLETLGANMLQNKQTPGSLFRGMRTLTPNIEAGSWVHGTPSPALAAKYGPNRSAPALVAEYQASPLNRYSADFLQDMDVTKQMGRTWDSVVSALRQPPNLRGDAFGLARTNKNLWARHQLKLADPRELVTGKGLEPADSWVPWYETKLQSGINNFRNWAFVHDGKLLRVPANKQWQHILRNITSPVYKGSWASRIPQGMEQFMGRQGFESRLGSEWFRIQEYLRGGVEKLKQLLPARTPHGAAAPMK